MKNCLKFFSKAKLYTIFYVGTGATKIENLKEELEDAESKVEQCRDQLAAEMFQLMSRETELAQTIIQYIKLQRAYHESALHCLEDLIPGLESYISKFHAFLDMCNYINAFVVKIIANTSRK